MTGMQEDNDNEARKCQKWWMTCFICIGEHPASFLGIALVFAGLLTALMQYFLSSQDEDKKPSPSTLVGVILAIFSTIFTALAARGTGVAVVQLRNETYCEQFAERKGMDTVKQALMSVGCFNPTQSDPGSKLHKKIEQSYQSWRNEVRSKGPFGGSAEGKKNDFERCIKEAKDFIQNIAPQLACYWSDDRTRIHPGGQTGNAIPGPGASDSGQHTTSVEDPEASGSGHNTTSVDETGMELRQIRSSFRSRTRTTNGEGTDIQEPLI